MGDVRVVAENITTFTMPRLEKVVNGEMPADLRGRRVEGGGGSDYSTLRHLSMKWTAQPCFCQTP